ncbi:aminotransferase [Penicillium sp. IBT 35674x]|nr:aminotransferase [Penicillium sp. IBT 35674x]
MAKESFERLHLKSTNTYLIFEDIQSSIADERAVAESSNWRRTRISCGMFAVQQFTGIAFDSQILYFLCISGLPVSFYFKLALGEFEVAMLGNIVS